MKMLDFGKRAVCALAGLACALSVASTAHGENRSAYWNARDSQRAGGIFNPAWMAELPDDMPLNYISIPGTHDSMTYDNRIKYRRVARTQSMGLREQLDAGIRALDIRLRFGDNDALLAFHDKVYLYSNFTEVLNTVRDFLRAYPSETVLMRVKDEGVNVAKTFGDGVRRYLSNYREMLLLDNRLEYGVTLKEVRGKLVILATFSLNLNDLGLPWNTMNIQDEWEADKGIKGLDKKWGYVASHIEAARSQNGRNGTIFVNFLSASGFKGNLLVKDVEPSFYATGDGKDNHYEGINSRFYEYARRGGAPYVGIVFADFPGPALIEHIIDIATNINLWSAVPSPFLARTLSVGADGTLWAISTKAVDGGYEIWRFADSKWNLMPGGAVRIAVDPAGNAWVVNSLNQIYRWDRDKKQWQREEGSATDIAIGADASVWIIGSDMKPGGFSIAKRRAGANVWIVGADKKPGGFSLEKLGLEKLGLEKLGAGDGQWWSTETGGATRIAVAGGVPWVINDAGAIFRRKPDGGWDYMQGKGWAISAGKPGVYVIGDVAVPGGKMPFRYKRNGWQVLVGGAVEIAVGPQRVYVANDQGHIFAPRYSR